MNVRTNIEYSFTANYNTYHVGDYVKVKAEFLEVWGEIIEIGFDDFEIKINGDDERHITIKYDNLKSIYFDW